LPVPATRPLLVMISDYLVHVLVILICHLLLYCCSATGWIGQQGKEGMNGKNEVASWLVH